jgi:hypothetical protein
MNGLSAGEGPLFTRGAEPAASGECKPRQEGA